MIRATSDKLQVPTKSRFLSDQTPMLWLEWVVWIDRDEVVEGRDPPRDSGRALHQDQTGVVRGFYPFVR
jgi:hypothetical protein